MRHLLASVVAVSVFASAAWLVVGGTTSAARNASARTVTVHLGDHIRVSGAPLGCRVVRMREFDGRIVVDCRRAGSLRGTYGTVLTAREAALIRFESSHTARLAYVATHHRAVRKCGAER
jgi:hypothetical protein